MGKTISIHSFRGGTGKSNITANLGYTLAAQGKKVCIVDTDVQSPGIHIPLQLANYKGATLNDFLFNNVDINKVSVDISSKLTYQKIFVHRSKQHQYPSHHQNS